MSSSAKKLAIEAKKTCQSLSLLSTAEKNSILRAMAGGLLKHSAAVLRENKKDVNAARKWGLAPAMLSRLSLDAAKLKKISQAILSVAVLPDPVGRLLSEKKRPN